MEEKLNSIKVNTLQELESITDLRSLEDLRIKVLGKNGELTKILRGMSNLDPERKPLVGKAANEVRLILEQNIIKTKKVLEQEQCSLQILNETIDVTMPGRQMRIGNKHPMTKVVDQIKSIFIGLGFTISEGPDVEIPYYTFDALNIPNDHPAKDEQDTFYVEGGFVLRPQTSPVQVRTMEKGKLPIKIIAPGRVFRADEVDATHSPVFHQLEGLVIDKGISMANLKGTLILFAKEFFGDRTDVRFRPHYFPFTEPSAEMDVTCFSCHGDGCRICKQTGWIEILGCGMVHPKVLSMSNIDCKLYTGFAFGMGLERIAMQHYKITDLRLMYENDVNFIKQF